MDDNFIFKNLKECVETHLRSDVPYCLFYSGGIDSTLIMYFIHILNLNKKICAYNVNFENNDKTAYELTKNLKNQFNIELNQIKFTEEDFGTYFHLQQKKLMNLLRTTLSYRHSKWPVRHLKILKWL